MSSLESNSKGVIQLDNYRNDTFTLGDYSLTQVLDNILLVEYIDESRSGEVMHGGIVIPTAHVQKAWRIGRVILAGPNCKFVKEGDYVCTPNDKGIPVGNISVYTSKFKGKIAMGVFLDEPRIFGVVTPSKNESKSRATKKSTGK